MLGIERLLLNILFIIVSISLFQIFFADRAFKEQGWESRVLVGLFASVAVVLCMTFPFVLLPGYIFDMRVIPMIISILYSGYEAGLMTIAVMLAYRYYLGGDGFYTSLYIYPVVIVVAFWLVSRFRSANRERRHYIAMFLVCLNSSLVIFVTLLRLPEEQVKIEFLQYAIQYAMIHAAGIWLAVYLVENILRSIQMKREIQRAEKLYAMGELAASVAHEIRNPLTVVRGFIQLFGQQQIPPEKRQDYIHIMLEELNRAEEIISDYLTFARPQVEKQERIEVGQQLQQIVGVMTSYALLKNVKIDMEAEDSLFLTLSRSKFSQCLINLMKNGVEAMPEGGVLTIRAFHREGSIVIDVIDTGKGMTREEIRRLGNPFYSTKEKGTGLGLMVSYRIIEALGGTVKVRSEKGSGTHFSIILPVSMQ